MLNKFWNKKASGIPAAVLLITVSAWRKFWSKMHSFLYKRNIAECGKNVSILTGTRFKFPQTVVIKDNVSIGYRCDIKNDEIPSGTIVIGNNCSIANQCTIDYSGGLIIGDNSHIAWGTYIITHTHGYDPHSAPLAKPLHIGNNVFIGAKSIITPNVNNIGNNVMIGTGAIVTKDIPDNAIVAGNPAKIIKYKE